METNDNLTETENKKVYVCILKTGVLQKEVCVQRWNDVNYTMEVLRSSTSMIIQGQQRKKQFVSTGILTE